MTWDTSPDKADRRRVAASRENPLNQRPISIARRDSSSLAIKLTG